MAPPISLGVDGVHLSTNKWVVLQGENMDLMSVIPVYEDDPTGYRVGTSWVKSEATKGIVISEAREDVPLGQLTQACESGIEGMGHSPPHHYLINVDDLDEFNAKYPRRIALREGG